jgi:hypothetical protein
MRIWYNLSSYGSGFIHEVIAEGRGLQGRRQELRKSRVSTIKNVLITLAVAIQRFLAAFPPAGLGQPQKDCPNLNNLSVEEFQ